MKALLKVALIAITMNGSAVTALEQEEVIAAKKLLVETFGKGRASDYQHARNLSETERKLLSAYCRSVVDDIKRKGEKDDAHISSNMMLRLALLDDDWAREQIVKAFWNQPRARAVELHYLKDSKVIAMIGDGLFIEEEWYRIGDLGYPPTQDNIAEVVFDTLGNSPDFNADVINWARRVHHWSAESGDRELKIARDWYRANEAKLKAGDFKAVQPGAEPPDSKASAPAGGAPSSLPPGSKPATAPASFPGNVQSPESSGNVYAWIAALLLTICGGLVWLLKRKRI